MCDWIVETHLVPCLSHLWLCVPVCVFLWHLQYGIYDGSRWPSETLGSHTYLIWSFALSKLSLMGEETGTKIL